MKLLASVLLLFIILTGNLSAQVSDSTLDNDMLILDQSEEVVPNVNLEDNKIKRFKPGLEVGTSFMYSPNNFYGPSYYVAPNYSFMVTPRLSFSAGMAYEYSQIYPIYHNEYNQNEMLPMTRAFLYARGSYALNSRVIVGASAYKVINDVPRLKHEGAEMEYNYQGMSLDVSFRISDAFSIGFQFHMQDGSYYNNTGLIPYSGYVPLRGF